jgi:hypothetical protein
MLTYETHGDNTTYNQTRKMGSVEWITPTTLARDAAQHTYKTRGSSSLVVQGSKSDIK